MIQWVLVFIILLWSDICFVATMKSEEIRGRHLRSANVVPKISAVMLTTSKDGATFEVGIKSALKHLVDVDKFYVITPHKDELILKYDLGERVIFVAEQIFKDGGFNFTSETVADTMISAVKEHGKYPLENGNSAFERVLWGKTGWHLQQLLKLYAGRILKLDNYVLLDGDCVWFKDTNFIAANQDSEQRPFKYLYATSTQANGAYRSSSVRINGVPFIRNEAGGFRSGVVHHMVLVKEVLESLFEVSEKLHGLPMWRILLESSALEMTCRAPSARVCGEGSTLSEYDLYFNYARTKFPQTVELRPLLWANGPRPGLLYWVDPSDEPVVPLLSADTAKYKWKSYKKSEELKVFHQQMEADRIAGFDYIGYHTYAKRRYYELHKGDLEHLCKGVAKPFNTTCSYRGLSMEELRPDRTPQNWFAGCGCFMARIG